MEAVRIEKVDKVICDNCHLRFKCYTERKTVCGLFSPISSEEIEFDRLSDEDVKKMHIAKAKRQGHYFPVEPADAGE
jgi:hypothetical protein